MTATSVDPGGRPGRRDRRRAAPWALPLAGAVLLVLLLWHVGPTAVLELATTMGWRLVGVVLLFVLHEVVRAVTLGHCLHSDHGLSLLRLLGIRFLGEAARVLTHGGPVAAEPTRAWLLARTGIQRPAAWAGAMAELLANMWVSALLAVVVLGITLRAGPVPPPAAATARVLAGVSLMFVVVAAAAVAGRVYLIGTVLRRLGSLSLAGRRLRLDPTTVRRMEDDLLAVLRDRPRTLLRILALQVLAQAVLVIEVYASLRAMDVDVSWMAALRVEAFTKLVNMVQVLGAAEGAYTFIFPWLGLTPAVGLTLALVKRARSVIVALAGLAALAVIRPTLGTGKASSQRVE